MTTQQARDGTNGGTLTVLNHDGRTLFWAQVMAWQHSLWVVLHLVLEPKLLPAEA